ncbi:bifunctional hydroxymethylpyrimidine kinase/phosphomethylpyrimidine kinase [Glycocaulis sp.]|uniref:bifunctional hydroxymethylpyrimidine kinase/phosphomethylpyrimidine kinase n=1 Tax=Glycocaulis sp. TaxID=1969725 RepID=UPI0025C46569|nr:bifunctional hydroxymethylpyrimidine kinase/phosphomethylpyrimidine kinase [Glycocaulis sp.]MCH8520989.1 bifunctional hydroxymethylpyrimidine kinase/phosphomethylpyrimidine kinase [Glycocaulis sp.]
MDKTIIVLSSLVAGSRVGGGVSAHVLSRAGFTPAHVPTVVFGRHPGLGAPGGGAVSDDVFQSALDGLLRSGSIDACTAILTGYFASPAQVEAAARFIEGGRERAPGIFVLVDPICGDGVPDGSAHGLYIHPDTAQALKLRLVPLADCLTPNAFELAFLAGRSAARPDEAAVAARTLNKPVIATSVPAGPGRLAVVAVDGNAVVTSEVDRLEGVPHGTGDLLAAEALTARLGGMGFEPMAGHLAQVCDRVIRRTLAAGAEDLIMEALDQTKAAG